MDIQPSNQQSISDDQELAKVLAGVNARSDDQSEEIVTTPVPTPAPAPVADDQAALANDDTAIAPVEEPAAAPSLDEPSFSQTTAADSDLTSIKNDALQELRPLVDKLDVSPEEKFDTYLLLLRSTDDKSLIAPAHDAAKNIPDEARRAQALLDIIKEIDFLSQPQQ